MANSAGNKFAGDTVSDSETGTSDDGSGSEEDVASWISWFCSLKGNEFFCEVEEDFIQDDFNLSGLSTQVPYYDYALDLILDAEPGTNEILTEEQHELVESAAEVLYVSYTCLHPDVARHERHDGEVPQLRVWALPQSAVRRSALPPSRHIRRAPPEHCQAVLSQV